jgi:hypothetical protein
VFRAKPRAQNVRKTKVDESKVVEIARHQKKVLGVKNKRLESLVKEKILLSIENFQAGHAGSTRVARSRFLKINGLSFRENDLVTFTTN